MDKADLTLGSRIDAIFSTIGPHQTIYEWFSSLPRGVLSELVGLLELVRNEQMVGPNSCCSCGHYHGDGVVDFNFRMRMLGLAKKWVVDEPV